MDQNIQNQLLKFNVPPDQPVYMSPEEASDIYSLGYLVAHNDKPNPDNPEQFLIQLSATGVAALRSLLVSTQDSPQLQQPPELNPFAFQSQPTPAEFVPQVSAPAIAPVGQPATATLSDTSDFEIDDVSLGRGKSVDTYPWSKIGLNQSYHVKFKPEGELTGDALAQANLKRVRSSVNAQNAKPENRKDVPGKFKKSKSRRNKLDSQGKPVIGEDGKNVKVVTEIDKQVTEQVVQYKAALVDANDIRGIGVRIYRIK